MDEDEEEEVAAADAAAVAAAILEGDVSALPALTGAACFFFSLTLNARSSSVSFSKMFICLMRFSKFSMLLTESLKWKVEQVDQEERAERMDEKSGEEEEGEVEEKEEVGLADCMADC